MSTKQVKPSAEDYEQVIDAMAARLAIGEGHGRGAARLALSAIKVGAAELAAARDSSAPAQQGYLDELIESELTEFGKRLRDVPPLSQVATATTKNELDLRAENERLRTELGRAYRALQAYTHARDRGVPLPDHAIAYHSLTEGAAKRFVKHGTLDGSEYFIGKSVDVLHAVLRGEDP